MKIVLPCDAILASRKCSTKRHVWTSVVEQEIDQLRHAGVPRVGDAGPALVVQQFDVGVRLKEQKKRNCKLSLLIGDIICLVLNRNIT